MHTYRFNPQAAGSLFPTGEFEYTVHSVFPSALNCRVEGQPYLVSLVTKPAALHPRGVLVTPLDFRSLGFVPGSLGRFCESPPERVTGRMPSLEAGRWDKQVVDRAWVIVNDLREKKGLNNGAFSNSLRQAAGLLTRDFALGARLLVGLGEGLTPAGDDFLIGYLAAKWGQGKAETLRAPLLSLLPRTNEISAAFLASACEGQFSVALVALGQAFNDDRGWEKALSALADQGHSSGLDTAWGFVHGLSEAA